MRNDEYKKVVQDICQRWSDIEHKSALIKVLILRQTDAVLLFNEYTNYGEYYTTLLNHLFKIMDTPVSSTNALTDTQKEQISNCIDFLKTNHVKVMTSLFLYCRAPQTGPSHGDDVSSQSNYCSLR